MTISLAGTAILATKRYRYDLAARLFGAADNLAAAIGYRIGQPFRDCVERATAETRENLGETDYAATYSTGRQASLGNSIAEAVEFTQHPTAAAPVVREQPHRHMEVNEAGLTPRELEVLRLIAEGRTDREIGELLSISRATAARHVANILLKLDVSSRTQAAAYAFRQGLT
jgi:DNA-binding CsgD family transcriptional regulator